MKLRGKLILSFGASLGLIILVLGAILYVTLAETINKDRAELFRVNAHAFGDDLKDAIGDHVRKIEPAVHRVLVPCPGDKTHECWEGDFHVHGGNRSDDILTLVDVVSWTGGHPSLGKPEHGQGSIDPVMLLSYNQLTRLELESYQPVFLEQSHEHYLVWPLAGGEAHPDFILIFRVSMEKLHALASSLLQDANAIAVLSDKDRIVLVLRQGGDKIPEITSQTMTQLARKDSDSVVQQGDFFALKAAAPILGWRLTTFLPREIYLGALVSLKNRVIAATVIMLWVAVWAVLIAAHRISRPIIRLSKATQDIAVFSYETPLEIPEGQDEIGVLARNFEQMRQRIKELITLDPLTGTHNRRYLMHVLGIEVSRALRMERSLSCLMIDLDHFKTVNDTFGHPCGDRVLADVGHRLSGMIRNYETVGRYGGEEFIVILPDTDPMTAHEVAERIRIAISERHVGCKEGQTFSISASIGVGFLDADRARTPETILAMADKALYQAKNEGRNKTVLATSS